MFEDKAKELIEEYGVLPITVLIRKTRISFSKAEEIHAKLVQPIKIIYPSRIERFTGSPTKKFWNSRKDWIV